MLDCEVDLCSNFSLEIKQNNQSQQSLCSPYGQGPHPHQEDPKCPWKTPNRKIQGLTLQKTQDSLGATLEHPSSGQVQAPECRRVFSSALRQGSIANAPWRHLCRASLQIHPPETFEEKAQPCGLGTHSEGEPRPDQKKGFLRSSLWHFPRVVIRPCLEPPTLLAGNRFQVGHPLDSSQLNVYPEGLPTSY